MYCLLRRSFCFSPSSLPFLDSLSLSLTGIFSDHGIRQSMSRKGNCLDIAMTENFFGLLKKEKFYGHEYDYKDYPSFVKMLDDYIDWYNRNRIKLRIQMSPDSYQSTISS